jgi:hypothetical protein
LLIGVTGGGATVGGGGAVSTPEDRRVHCDLLFWLLAVRSNVSESVFKGHRKDGFPVME